MSVDVAEYRIDGRQDPLTLCLGNGHRLNSQRTIRSRVLADEPIGLKPTGKCSLCDFLSDNLPGPKGFPAVPGERVLGTKLRCRNALSISVVARLPDEVIIRDIKLVPRLGM